MGKNDMPTLDVIRIKHYSSIERCKSSELSSPAAVFVSEGTSGRRLVLLETRSHNEEVFTGLIIFSSPHPDTVLGCE